MAPDSFDVFLSITLLVGVVIGGLASISGAFFGALFIQFMPNIADQISKAAPWAIYGVVLIAFMYAMPTGVAGFLRLARLRFARWRAARGRVRFPRPPTERDMNPTLVRITRRAALALAIGTAFAAQNAAAQAAKYGPGASATEIKLGQTMPYSGPASAYGTIGKVEQAYFKMINDKGGINGRKINLISLDDGYSPPKTVEQVRRLVEQDEVLALFQTLGTPSNSAIHKYVNAKKVPHLLLATGATKWGDPKDYPWTMGFNLSYQSEGQIYAKWLLKNKPDAKIAILYQNDDYGKDVLKGVKDGLGAAGAKMIVKEATYEVTDPTVDSQILTLQGSGADTFIDITTPKFGAQAMRKAFDSGWKPLHFLNNVSASIGSVLVPAGRREGGRRDHGQLLQGPERSAVEGRPGDARVARLHGPLLPRGRSEGPEQPVRLPGGADHDPDPEAVRQRPDARERHAPGGQPEALQAAAAAAGHGAQHRPERLLPGPAGAAAEVHRHAVAALRRPDEHRRALARPGAGAGGRRPCHEAVTRSLLDSGMAASVAAEAVAMPRLLNRERAILEFNRRVLAQAQRADVPLLERLRYVCIVSSNLDEFFEVRFADCLEASRQPGTGTTRGRHRGAGRGDAMR